MTNLLADMQAMTEQAFLTAPRGSFYEQILSKMKREASKGNYKCYVFYHRGQLREVRNLQNYLKRQGFTIENNQSNSFYVYW